MASMVQLVVVSAAGPRGRMREALYKVDHPRWIDSYIDFFGDGAPARLAEVEADRRSERRA